MILVKLIAALWCFGAAKPFRQGSVVMMTNVANTASDYFSANCFHFLYDANVRDDAISKMAKVISTNLDKSFSFCDIAKYHDMLAKSNQDKCHVSLRIIFHLEDISQNIRSFNHIFKHHVNEIRSGAWLIFSESLDEKFIANALFGVQVPFDIQILIAWLDKDKVWMKEVYQVAPSFPLRQKDFGMWSLKNGFVPFQTLSRYFRRTDLEGYAIKVGFIEDNFPYTLLEGQSLTGYFGDIWNILGKSMNISSKYRTVRVGKNEGSSDPWHIVIEGVRNEKTDVGLGDFVSTSERMDFLHFSYPLFVGELQVFYQISANESLSHALLLPFESEIWGVVFVWWFFTSISYFCSCSLLNRVAGLNSDVRFFSSFLITFRGLCGQAGPKTPKTSSGRILFLLTYLVAAILIPTYSASLTNYLTSEVSTPSFENLLEFYVAGTHKLTLLRGSFEHYFFESDNNKKPYEQRLYEEQVKNKPLPKSYQETLQIVCQEKQRAAFTISSNLIWETNKVENRLLREECLLGKLNQNVGVTVSSFILPKRSRFRGLIDHHLKIFQTTGLIERLKKKYWTVFKTPRKKIWRQVSMKESSELFHILLAGLFLSLIILLIERGWNKRQLRKPQKKRLRVRNIAFLH